MAKINLDKYYTPVELAKSCIDKTFEVIGRENVTDIIEPSAGEGSFSLQMDCMAYDIAPEHESIIEQDFLKLELPYKKGRLVIGNPPYGRGNYTAVHFYKKAYSIGDYIAFILPISQFNNNMYMYEFDMIKSIDLGLQLYSDRKVHCCLNIYKRPKIINKKPVFELNDVKLKGVGLGKSRNDKVPEKYDFSISAFGASVGKICEKENEYCQQTYFTINPKFKEPVLQKIKEANWCNIFGMTANPRVKHWQIIKYLKEQMPELS